MKTCLPESITEAFKDYYEILYNIAPRPTYKDPPKKHRMIEDFLQSLDMPRLPDVMLYSLESPIAPEDVLAALYPLARRLVLMVSLPLTTSHSRKPWSLTL